MVEVIEYGKRKVADCEFCGSKLSYSVNDIIERKKYLSLSQREPCMERYIICPNCEKRVKL